MYLDTKTGRSWRKSRKRGVSPIIATILLVAITVVLAAVLYVLISNLTNSGSNSTPLGGAFAWGGAHNVTSTSSAAAGCTINVTCYSIDVASTSNSLQASGLYFSLKTASGSTAPIIGNITLVSASGSTLSVWTPGGTTGTWSVGNQPVAGGDALVINWTGGTALTGDVLNAVGQNGFTGTVSSPALPA